MKTKGEKDMMSTKDMLLHAQKRKYAIPAFNIHNLETIQVVVETAAQLKSPVILATTPSTVKYAGKDFLLAITKTAQAKYDIPIALHLDHSDDLEFTKSCLDAGYKSVMIDSSKDAFEENIRKTKEIVDYAHRLGATVEAELGRIGGTEDDLTVDQKDSILTDPDFAQEFVERTGVDSLAVAIGTAHGLYKFEPKLDFDRLENIRKKVSIPLVLHGASGVPSYSVKKSIGLGICKVNIATELKVAFSKAVKEYFIQHPEANDLRKYLIPAKDGMKKVIIEKIKMCGSEGRV